MDLTEKTLESREVYRGRILRVREDMGAPAERAGGAA